MTRLASASTASAPPRTSSSSWRDNEGRQVFAFTRRDGEEFLTLAPRVPIRTVVETFALEAANTALDRLRTGLVHGAAVLLP